MELAGDSLAGAVIVVDRSGNREVRNQLASYLRQQAHPAGVRVRRFKMDRSERNNLLQLADYMVGVSARSLIGDAQAQEMRKIVSEREARTLLWPEA
jgi:hypothetical protein